MQPMVITNVAIKNINKKNLIIFIFKVPTYVMFIVSK